MWRKVNIGVASKDKSLVEIKNGTIKDSQYGLVAYVKKKEYGSAIIRSSNCEISEVNVIHLIEEKSSLILNEQEIIGEEKNLQKLFY